MKDKDELIAKIAQLETAKKELESRKYSEDLFLFNKHVLRVEDGKNSVSLADFHQNLCEFVVDDGTEKKLILVPRGHLKSTIVTVGYSLMRIAQDPGVRILIANATYDMGCSFLGQIKKHLQNNETFIDYYGDLATKAPRWSENMITVPKEESYSSKEATVTAYGMGGNLVSQHYDLIIMDDIVNRDYVNTAEQIEKTVLFYKDALDLLEPGGKMIVIGTRWHDADLYGWILDQSNPEQVHKSFDTFIRQAYEGDLGSNNISPLWPHKFNADVLSTLKREKGPYEFSCQYMNDPVPQDKAEFKIDWFKQVLEDELKMRDITYYTMVDPAISQAKSADRTAIVTIGVDEFNNWFVVNVIWDHMLPNRMIDYIFQNWEHYKPKTIGIELTAYQKSLQYSLMDEMRRRNIFLPIVELKAEKAKGERIRGLIPRYANGSVYHLTQCPHREEMEDEMLRFPRGKHDDIVDALAYGMQIAKPSRKTPIGRRRRRRNRYMY